MYFIECIDIFIHCWFVGDSLSYLPEFFVFISVKNPQEISVWSRECPNTEEEKSLKNISYRVYYRRMLSMGRWLKRWGPIRKSFGIMSGPSGILCSCCGWLFCTATIFVKFQAQGHNLSKTKQKPTLSSYHSHAGQGTGRSPKPAVQKLR